jgi:hypothetical protein
MGDRNMKKSKYFFLILCLAYICAAVFSCFDWFAISENILFALSLSALLISIGEVLENVILWRDMDNNYQYDLMITSEFLSEKIKNTQGKYIPISLRNVKEYMDVRRHKRGQPKHPREFQKNYLDTGLSFVAGACFVAGIAVFILFPMFKIIDIDYNLSKIITVLAFAAMSFNIFIKELIATVQDSTNKLCGEMHCVIQTVFPEFQTAFSMRTTYYNDYLATVNAKDNVEDSTNG